MASDERVSLADSPDSDGAGGGGGPPVPATGQNSLPLDGDFVVVVSLLARTFTAPVADPTLTEQSQEYYEIFQEEPGEDGDVNQAIDRGIRLAADRSYSGAVCIDEWM